MLESVSLPWLVDSCSLRLPVSRVVWCREDIFDFGQVVNVAPSRWRGVFSTVSATTSIFIYNEHICHAKTVTFSQVMNIILLKLYLNQE